MRKTWLSLLALLLLAPLGLGAETDELAPVEVGQPAPDFTLLDHRGEAHQLGSYLGTPVALGFFDARNGYCDDLLPALQELKLAFPGLTALAIDNSPDGGTVDELKEMEKELQIDFPLLRGGLEVAERYGFKTAQGAVLIDAGGVVRARTENLIAESFVDAVRSLLAP